MRLLYFSPVPWTSFAQRPHKFVEWFHAKHGNNVLWFDPYPTRFPQLADFRRINNSDDLNATMNILPPWLTVICPYSWPIEPLPWSGRFHQIFWRKLFREIDTFTHGKSCQIAIGKPTELACQVLARNSNLPSLYDAMDDFPMFYSGFSRIAMARREKKIVENVTQILVSSTALADRFAQYHFKINKALNACAIETLPPIETLTQFRGPPVLGYVGTIGKWFDWQLVFKLAASNPSMLVRLIGPIYSSPPEFMPKNIELLPACDHAEAMMHMQKFTVGLIPFKRTELTASVDPIKYYEYRAMGLPVLSTRFGEMALRNEDRGVFLIDKDSDLKNIIKKATNCKCKTLEIQEFRNKNSWDVRFSDIKITEK